MTEVYVTQVSEEIGGRDTKKQSQKVSRTKSRVLGDLDEFLLNRQVRKCSGTVPGTTPNSDLENREPNRDCSQNDSAPKVELSICRTSNSPDSEQEETPHSPVDGKYRSETVLLV